MDTTTPPDHPTTSPPDPATFARVYHNACREALIVSGVWLLAFLWAVGYCYLFGYQHTAESWPVKVGLVEPWTKGQSEQIAGFPDWVMFGIIVPWLLCSAFTIVFAFVGIANDPLGPEVEEEVSHES